MAEVWLYRLKPASPFHFGERGVGIEATEEVFHSDSLFSALAIGARMWEGEEKLKGLLSRFRGPNGPPFRLTSLFPYAGKVLFFPRPMLRIEGKLVEEKAKLIKDIRFVSQGIFQAMLRREALDAHLEEGNLIHGGAVWLTAEEYQALPEAEKGEQPAIWRRHLAPRVTVDRLSAASQVYQAGRVTFASECGLWFLLEAADPEVKLVVGAALDYLSEAGLGGERSVGHGQFKVESCQRFSPPWPQQGSAFVILSLYHPTRAELEAGVLGQPAAYELIQRRGWVSSPERSGQRRKSLFCLAEGSVMRSLGKASYGDLADVTPELPGSHPVFRYGFAFPVPLDGGLK